MVAVVIAGGRGRAVGMNEYISFIPKYERPLINLEDSVLLVQAKYTNFVCFNGFLGSLFPLSFVMSIQFEDSGLSCEKYKETGSPQALLGLLGESLWLQTWSLPLLVFSVS